MTCWRTSAVSGVRSEDFGAAARVLAEGAEVSPLRRRLWRRASRVKRLAVAALEWRARRALGQHV
jgi:hypothetical protein